MLSSTFVSKSHNQVSFLFSVGYDLFWSSCDVNDFSFYRKRRGAFNAKQLMYLEKYKPKMRLRFKDANGQNCCIQ